MHKQLEVKANHSINQKHKHDDVKKHSQNDGSPYLLHLDIKIHLHIARSVIKDRVCLNYFDSKSIIPVINSISPNLTKFVRTVFLETNIFSKKQTVKISIDCCKTIISCCCFLFKLQFTIVILIDSTYIVYSDHELLSSMLISNPMQGIRSYTFSCWVNKWVKENFSIGSVNPSGPSILLHVVNHQKGIVHFVNLKSIEILLAPFVLFRFVRTWIS